MTDCTLAAPAVSPRVSRRDSRRTSGRASGRASRRALARTRRVLPGIPSWTRLLGVTVVPVESHDPHGPEAWVISAGAGTGHIAALFHTGADADRPRGH
jgi:hypothetical protein